MNSIGILVGPCSRGTNMSAIIGACRDGTIEAQVTLAISTRPGSPALAAAAAQSVATTAVAPKEFDNPIAFGAALLSELAAHRVTLVCMAGYTYLLPPNVIAEYRGRCLNIHPALLPQFGGKGMYGRRVHEAVLASGVKESGCTVHVVDEEYDHGPIVFQSRVPVLAEDTPETLGARVLEAEHRTYVAAIQKYLAEQRDRRD